MQAESTWQRTTPWVGWAFFCQLVGWPPSPLGLLPFVALLTVVWARDVVFPDFQAFFCQSFGSLRDWENLLIRIWQGIRGCKIVG